MFDFVEKSHSSNYIFHIKITHFYLIKPEILLLNKKEIQNLTIHKEPILFNYYAHKEHFKK